MQNNLTLEEALQRIEELEYEVNTVKVEENKDEKIEKLEKENLVLRTELNIYKRVFSGIGQSL